MKPTIAYVIKPLELQIFSKGAGINYTLPLSGVTGSLKRNEEFGVENSSDVWFRILADRGKSSLPAFEE